MTDEPTRVVLVDDHPVYRDGVADALGDEADIEVVGRAADGDAAVAAVDAHRPDVVLMDLRMPGTGGLPATARIAATHPGTSVVVLTMSDDDDSVFAAMRAGALGYVLKGADPEDIIRAITGVAAGNAILGQGVARRAMAMLSQPAPSSSAFPALTPREHEILGLIATGLGNAAIAGKLGVSVNTVNNHVSNVFAKLRVSNRAEAIIRARNAGLGS